MRLLGCDIRGEDDVEDDHLEDKAASRSSHLTCFALHVRQPKVMTDVHGQHDNLGKVISGAGSLMYDSHFLNAPSLDRPLLCRFPTLVTFVGSSGIVILVLGRRLLSAEKGGGVIVDDDDDDACQTE
ncbi:hypothetical protein FPCIR_11991 [Fusarium pseudocircinatum]|uniref:Uncharacterized protein n=1 Tax=Fusarium pseudocircinatum TaxID=56676 RepID=A0A8H5KNQ9_9HYPO|nr:hypothetical protein FPCIR_11991 [Fusarium pseudocircinatum]